MEKLQGTEKQVSLAENIRKEIIDSISADLEMYKGMNNQAKVQSLSKAIDELSRIDSAEWWINNREFSAGKLARWSVDGILSSRTYQPIQYGNKVVWEIKG